MAEIGIGPTLRRVRIEQGREVAEAAAATSMRSVQVEALEEERFEVFGGDVYARGFLRSYAVWLGLDPAPLLDDYRRHVQREDNDAAALASGPVASGARPVAPVWLGWVAGAVLLAVGLVGIVQVIGDRSPVPADAVDEAAAPPQPAAPSPPVVTSSPSEPAASAPPDTASPDPSPSASGVDLTLAFEDRSWIRVTVDGQTLQEGVVEAGQAIALADDDEVVVRVGNAGGVRARLNGEGLGLLGSEGDVATFRFTPDGIVPAA